MAESFQDGLSNQTAASNGTARHVDKASAKFRYRMLLPVIWLVATWVSWEHPGDEYGFFFVSLLPTIWLMPFLDYVHLREVLPEIFISGAATMAVIGWGIDRLRIHLAIWLPLFVLGAGLLVWGLLSNYSSYERAMAKNGSLSAYLSAATNMSLYLVTILTALGALIIQAVSCFLRRGTSDAA